MTARPVPPQASRPRVLLCGYYGEHNLGDDALLQVLLSQLPAGVDPLVTAADQAAVQAAFQVATVDRRRLKEVLRALTGCQALVLGGGSLLQDSTSFRSLMYYGALITAARLRGLPVLLWGQGLGPLRQRRSRMLARAVLPMASAISWRDPASDALARSWGIKGQLGTDPVWALPPLEWHGRGGPIVLCWRPVQQLQEPGWRLLLAAVEQLAERFDRQVHWLPFHQHQDGGLLAELQARGLLGEALRRRSVQLEAATPEEAMAVFASASLVVAMRLHGLILAALSGSPCAALSYDPKVAAAAESLGCPCLDLGDLSQAESPEVAERLCLAWGALVDQPADAARREQLRHDTRVHAELLQRLALSIPGS